MKPVFAIVLLVLVLLAGLLALNAFLVMVLSGAIGHVFDAPRFYISFWQAAIVALALSLVGSFFGGKSK